MREGTTTRDTPAGRRPDAGGERAAENPERVLIVDDDATQLLLMGEVLRQRGFVVAEAANGALAQTAYRDFRPDLILLDIDMPEMDGFAACAAIRGDAGADLPIVMVTGLNDAASIHEAFAAGATDFITKPINWPLLHHRVEAIFAAAQTAKDLAANDARVSLLERLAPDVAVLVSKSGAILAQLGRQVLTPAPHDETKLESVWPEDVALAMRQRVSGVLKTRQRSSQEFELAVEGDVYRFEATFLPDGWDRVLMIVRRVSEPQQSETYRLAYYEAATQLPNRHLFEKCTNACLTTATLQERRAAILCVAFNQLVDMRAEQGSEQMTEMLKATARAIQGAIEPLDYVVPLDKHGARLARVSRNHFALLMTNILTREDAVAAAATINDAFAAPVRVADSSYALAPSVGIALFPENGTDVETLIGAAREAAEEARISDGYRFYSDSGHVSTLARLDFAEELRWAIEKRQLQLYYQPRLDLADGGITAVEALLRWNHPLRGIVPLDELLPLAEATGLMLPIGEWVLATACREIASLGRAGLRVAVNVSPYEFADDGLPERVERALNGAGLPPESLEIELTERALRRAEDPGSRLARLKDIGARVLLDDFGTGLSSLAALKQFPIHGLKIDASFVHGSQTRVQDKAICEVIVTMATKLGLRAIAEGVETLEQRELLERLGCDEIQGFFVSHPLPLADLASWLDGRGSRARSANRA